MTTTTTQTLDAVTAAATERRIREYASQVADQVAAGELDEETANVWLSDFQDRVMRDGPWG